MFWIIIRSLTKMLILARVETTGNPTVVYNEVPLQDAAKYNY